MKAVIVTYMIIALTFYDIDCGCASGGRGPNAKMVCIRLDDEQIFYV